MNGQDITQLRLSQPVDFQALRVRWQRGAEEAMELIGRLPVTERGCFYLNAAGKPVCPDPSAPGFAQLTRH